MLSCCSDLAPAFSPRLSFNFHNFQPGSISALGDGSFKTCPQHPSRRSWPQPSPRGQGCSYRLSKKAWTILALMGLNSRSGMLSKFSLLQRTRQRQQRGGSAAAAPDGLGQKSWPRPSKAITTRMILHEFAPVQHENNLKLGRIQLPNPLGLLLSNLISSLPKLILGLG